MLAKTKIKENFSAVEKVEPEKAGGETFTAEELAHLENELNKQVSEGNKIIDLGKAMRNARYLAMLDRSSKEYDEGKVVTFTEDEWEKFVDEQDIH